MAQKAIYWLLELAIHNAHIIFNEKNVMAGKKKVSLLDFQWELVKQLCWAPDADVEDDDEEGDEDQEEVVVVPAAPRIDPASRLVGGHKVHKMTIFPATRKANPQRPCRVCRKMKDIRKDTRFYCKACNVPLCKEYCFDRYHSVQKYY